MTIYSAPTKETRFVLRHVIGIEANSRLPGYDHLDEGSLTAVLEGVGRIAADVLAPLNRTGDVQGCMRHPDGTVSTPDGFRTAWAQWVGAGWATIEGDPEYGGMGLPQVIATAAAEYVLSANQSFETYTGLTAAAIAALEAAAPVDIKALYLPRMVSGEWSGTMNLTEPHCGTDLGLLRTRAEPIGDGRYAVTGTKIFITGGEQDLTANIVHLVLARLPEAPPGVRGISLFLVPKFLPDETGEPGIRNAVSCGSIEHKMGLRGSATCTMNYDGATGWLLGEPHKGLGAMFVMMNAARLAVGLQGVAQAEVAFQNARAYALERRQGGAGRGAPDPSQPADLLVAHPDVRRMLMEAKAHTEGLRALCLWCAHLVDVSRGDPDADARSEAEETLALLTPVIKAFASDKGFETTVNCQQVWGGHGYISENGMDQFVRDARIAMIYEGANGVQAMDLVSRKLGASEGRPFARYLHDVGALVADCRDHPSLMDIAVPLGEAAETLAETARWLAQAGAANLDDAGAGATAFLHLLGTVALGAMWLRMARAAADLSASDEYSQAWLDAKVETARFHATRMLPETLALAAKVRAGSTSVMAIAAEMI